MGVNMNDGRLQVSGALAEYIIFERWLSPCSSQQHPWTFSGNWIYRQDDNK